MKYFLTIVLVVLHLGCHAGSFNLNNKEVTYDQHHCMLEVFEVVAKYHEKEARGKTPFPFPVGKNKFSANRSEFFNFVMTQDTFNLRVSECMAYVKKKRK